MTARYAEASVIGTAAHNLITNVPSTLAVMLQKGECSQTAKLHNGAGETAGTASCGGGARVTKITLPIFVLSQQQHFESPIKKDQIIVTLSHILLDLAFAHHSDPSRCRRSSPGLLFRNECPQSLLPVPVHSGLLLRILSPQRLEQRHVGCHFVAGFVCHGLVDSCVMSGMKIKCELSHCEFANFRYQRINLPSSAEFAR